MSAKKRGRVRYVYLVVHNGHGFDYGGEWEPEEPRDTQLGDYNGGEPSHVVRARVVEAPARREKPHG